MSMTFKAKYEHRATKMQLMSTLKPGQCFLLDDHVHMFLQHLCISGVFEHVDLTNTTIVQTCVSKDKCVTLVVPKNGTVIFHDA